MARHEHEFAAIPSTLGPYGRQDVHLHVCFEVGCDHVLVGDGPNCHGTTQAHVHHRLSATTKDWWSRVEHEGEPLPVPLSDGAR